MTPKLSSCLFYTSEGAERAFQFHTPNPISQTRRFLSLTAEEEGLHRSPEWTCNPGGEYSSWCRFPTGTEGTPESKGDPTSACCAAKGRNPTPPPGLSRGSPLARRSNRFLLPPLRCVQVGGGGGYGSQRGLLSANYIKSKRKRFLSSISLCFSFSFPVCHRDPIFRTSHPPSSAHTQKVEGVIIPQEHLNCSN